MGNTVGQWDENRLLLYLSLEQVQIRVLYARKEFLY
jgi:hypothetical protein